MLLASFVLTNLHYYRPGYSTETALLKVVNDICCTAGSSKCTVLLALDISAAFDAVNHDVLCRRLEIYFRISGTLLITG